MLLIIEVMVRIKTAMTLKQPLRMILLSPDDVWVGGGALKDYDIQYFFD